MRRAQQQTITFTALDATGDPVTGLTFSPGEVQISKDGGARANVSGAVSELGVGVYALTLTDAESDAVWLHFLVRKTGIRPVDIAGSTTGHPSGVVVDDAANSASTFKTNRSEGATDHWVSTGIKFTTGALAGQIREVTGYNGTTKFVTVSPAFSAEPSAGDRFVFIDL